MLQLQNSFTYQSIPRRSSQTNLLAWRLPTAGLLLAATRLVCLNRQSLWFDEGYTLGLARARTIQEFFHTFGTLTTSEHLQPLYYLFIFFWSKVGGTTDTALRLPSVVFSVISGLIVYTFAKNRPNRRAASTAFPLLAVIFYASSSFAFYYAQEARPYALVQMLSFLVLALWNRDRDSRPAGSIAFTTVCFVSMIASPFALLLVLSLSATDLAFDGTRWFRRWRWPAVLIGATLIGYFLIGKILIPSYITADVVSLRQPLWMNAGYLIYGVFFGTTLGPSSGMLRSADKLHALLRYWPILVFCGISVVMLLKGVYMSLRTNSRSGSLCQRLAIAIAVYAVLLFCIFGFAGHLNLLPRHASALFAMIFLLCTSCAGRLTRSLRSDNICLTCGLGGVLALNLLSLWSYCSNPSFRKDDYRAAANILRHDESRRAGLAYLIAGDASLFRHYGVSLVDLSGVEPDNLAESLRRSSRDASEITLVINEHRNFRWDHSVDPSVVLQSTYRCHLQKSLASMEMIGCQLKGSGRYDVAAIVHASVAQGVYAR